MRLGRGDRLARRGWRADDERRLYFTILVAFIRLFLRLSYRRGSPAGTPVAGSSARHRDLPSLPSWWLLSEKAGPAARTAGAVRGHRSFPA
jgi:hypothetical protein